LRYARCESNKKDDGAYTARGARSLNGLI
jgi:hypothetical protein